MEYSQTSIMEFCQRLFNRTNATVRDIQAGVENVSRDAYIQKCVQARSANVSDVSSLIIIPYVLIFLLSVVGNSLVILTLVRHKKMRTITNMYLLNLAVSDLLLAVFCMPFTLIPMLMQDFIFGPAVCVMIRYAQAVSVGVSCGTLVAISIERFYGICQALRSRRWQTPSHSYKVILAIWLSCLTLMVPIAVFNVEIQINNGAKACREVWPSYLWESLYTVVLDIVILVIPLFIMAFSYGRIAKELWSDVSITTGGEAGSPLSESTDLHRLEQMSQSNGCVAHSPLLQRREMSRSCSGDSSANGKHHVQVLHPTYNSRVLKNKKRVVKMLCVVVLEYFVCWTPLFLLNSWTVLDYLNARNHFTPLLKSAILLLSYMSSCIHPITYCFMNQRFRQSFADAVRCCFKSRPNGIFSEASHAFDSDRAVSRSISKDKPIKITWNKRQT